MSPPWMAMARDKLGVREAPGKANSPIIMGWAKQLGAKVLGIVYGADEVPWCGLFVAKVIAEAGLSPPRIAVRAKAWADWGEPCKPCEGAVLVFARDGGGHVGFYAGETQRAFLVLGGNQGDAVTLALIEKSRLVASRWPAGVQRSGLPIIVAAQGPLSTNEA